MRVYADLFALVNLAVNGLLLWATAALTGTRAVPWRLAAAALLGTACAVAALWLPGLRSAGGAAVIAAAMLAAAFWPVAVRTGLLQAGVLVILSALTAGLALAWGGLIPGGLPGATAWLPLAAAGLAALLARRLWTSARRQAHAAAGAVEVEIEAAGGRALLLGRLDTANDAAEPLSGRPVILASADRLRELVGRPEALAGDPRWAPRFRLVPVRGLGGAPMLLPAVRVDAVRFRAGSARRVSRDAVVALYPGRIDAAGGCDAVVPPVLLEAGAAEATDPIRGSCGF